MFITDYDIEESCDELDRLINKANANLSFDMSEFVESFYESNDVVVSESAKDSILVKVKKFIAEILSSLTNFKNQLVNYIKKAARDITSDVKLHTAYKRLKEAEAKGVKDVEVIDVWTLRKTYTEASSKLNVYAKRLTKMKYTRTEDIDSDIEKFNTLLKKYDEELERVSKSKIKVSIKKLKGFIEDELQNRTHIVDSINESIKNIESMAADVDKIVVKKEIEGPDILQKKVGRKIGDAALKVVTSPIRLIKYILSGIAKFIRKWASKVIFGFVLVFA